MPQLFDILITSLIISSVQSYIEHPGPRVIPTKGEIWPKPQYQEKSDRYFIIQPTYFGFRLTGEVGCGKFIQDAFWYYESIIFQTNPVGSDIDKAKKLQSNDINCLGYLNTVYVNLTGNCSKGNLRPDFPIVENYTISVNATNATISAFSIWGVLRGLESFSHMVYVRDNQLVYNETFINDFPRFPHRGLLLDTSRHFIPARQILRIIDAMAFNKFNVLHWHIVDDQSFPYNSLAYPELSEQGAYHAIKGVYQQSDIQKIVNYASTKGIRVIPEFDIPAHTRSWGIAYPELLTQCYAKNNPTTDYGPMNPTTNYTYKFLRTLFAEVVQIFPDSYFHIGGNEVDFDCWRSNPTIKNFMKKNSFNNYALLEGFFIQKIADILKDLNRTGLVWEEVFANGIRIPNNTIVYVYKSSLKTLEKITASGKYGLYSSCWHLNRLDTGGDWEKYYKCEPLAFNGTSKQKKLLLGGEALLWSESVNEYNIMTRLWPRASAAAEKLWSSIDTTDIKDAARRLEEHACRLIHRGIDTQPPNGPGLCF